jgi:flagellar basal-body rod protein FlgF
MNSSSYQIAARMANAPRERMETSANNMANHAVPGYRRRISVIDPFMSHLRRSTEDINPSKNVDFAQGPLRPTGNPLDFGINGEGFFVLQNNGDEVLTRNGQFMVSSKGELATVSGLSVVGETGPIVLPGDLSLQNISVDSHGTIRSGETAIGKLKIVEVDDPHSLVCIGSTLFAPGKEPVRAATQSEVVHRSLESSNVSTVEEMVGIVEATRGFQTLQKMLTSQDQTEGKMIQAMSGK